MSSIKTCDFPFHWLPEYSNNRLLEDFYLDFAKSNPSLDYFPNLKHSSFSEIQPRNRIPLSPESVGLSPQSFLHQDHVTSSLSLNDISPFPAFEVDSPASLSSDNFGSSAMPNLSLDTSVLPFRPNYYPSSVPLSFLETSRNGHVYPPFDNYNEFFNQDLLSDQGDLRDLSYPYPWYPTSGGDKVIEPSSLTMNEQRMDGFTPVPLSPTSPRFKERLIPIGSNHFCQPERGRPNRRKTRASYYRYIPDSPTESVTEVVLNAPLSPVSRVSTPTNQVEEDTESMNVDAEHQETSSPGSSEYVPELEIRPAKISRRKTKPKSTTPDSFICSEVTCGKVFKRNHDLKRHFTSLHCAPSVECKSPKCRQMFSRHDNMMTHYASVHKKRKPHAPSRRRESRKHSSAN
ncbi:hypothetical protein HK098_003087 [Nowakowskiella sp. JEL0407]|nr:hypothetical protein HK098_003087 [Nowakowskiella sp. JEL0407]